MGEEPPTLHPVRLVLHHNRYAGILYDVDGNILRGDSGLPLNVFREEMKDAMVKGEVRFMHYLTKEPTYAYFITSAEQLGRFIIERKDGAPRRGTRYHVYIDPN